MCGIVGYIGRRQAKPILYAGLRGLEYRGYDSSGLCIVSGDNSLGYIRVVGNLDALGSAIDGVDLPGNVGIGHTRWATHGTPTERNAHPHLDCKGEIGLAHNGIIENHIQLRAELESRGHVFRSDTDTEVLVHLMEENYDGDLAEAMRRSLEKVEGAFAVVAVHNDRPDAIVAARRESPMVLGIGDNEYFIASAVPAFLAETNRVLFLEDNELLLIDRGGYSLMGLDGSEVSRQTVEVDWNLDAAEKGGYEDFMLKEVFDQPAAVTDTIRDKFDASGEVCFDEFSLGAEQARALRRIVVVACGTAFHAGLLAKYLFERWVSLPVEIEIASEFRYRNLVVNHEDLVVAISQSGETMDTLAGVREANRRGARVVAVVNSVGSQLTREAEGVIYTHAGPEIGVAATKTFTCQMAVIYLLAMHLGRLRGAVSDGRFRRTVEELRAIPAKMEQVLERQAEVVAVSEKYFAKKDFYFLGRSVGYPVAMEGALKLKEVSYIHAEGFPAGEMKHGPMALLDGEAPVIVIATRDSVHDKMVNNIEAVKSRGAPVLAVATIGDVDVEGLCDDVIWVPETREMLYPMLTVIPLQMLAYHISKLRGCNVDQPRNLAKTVTVE